MCFGLIIPALLRGEVWGIDDGDILAMSVMKVTDESICI